MDHIVRLGNKRRTRSRTGTGEKYVVLEGQANAEYDLVGIPIFSPDGVLEYLAEKSDSLCRVQYIPAR